MLLTQGHFLLILVKVMLHKKIPLFRMVATLFQYCNAVLHLKSSLRIIPCNITFNDFVFALPIGQMNFKSYLPSKKIYLCQTKRQAFFLSPVLFLPDVKIIFLLFFFFNRAYSCYSCEKAYRSIPT